MSIYPDRVAANVNPSSVCDVAIRRTSFSFPRPGNKCIYARSKMLTSMVCYASERVVQLAQVDSILSLLSLFLTCIVMDESAKIALESKNSVKHDFLTTRIKIRVCDLSWANCKPYLEDLPICCVLQKPKQLADPRASSFWSFNACTTR